MSKPRWEYVYGINPCFEVLRGGRRKVHEAFIADNATENARIKKLARYLADKGIPVESVGRDRLFQLSKSTEHQGAVIRCEPYPYVELDDVFTADKILLLDNVEDPHNVGAILRSAEIFGFHDILLPLKGVPEIYPSIVKVSAGATEHLKIVRSENANAYVKKAKSEGRMVVALDEEGAIDLSEAVAQQRGPLLLVIGGEGKSVGQFIIMNADIVAKIPQAGRINSLNASVAAGIAMYAFGVNHGAR
jgi:23S rRNA (guanosine2251-2'-O)-methyltransferase